MATQPATMNHQKQLQFIQRREAVRSETLPETARRKRSLVRWSHVQAFLIVALLLWPLNTILKDGIRKSIPILLSCHGAAFSMTLTQLRRWQVMTYALAATGLILIVLAILQKQL
jgi:hypothetical protein